MSATPPRTASSIRDVWERAGQRQPPWGLPGHRLALTLLLLAGACFAANGLRESFQRRQAAQLAEKEARVQAVAATGSIDSNPSQRLAAGTRVGPARPEAPLTDTQWLLALRRRLESLHRVADQLETLCAWNSRGPGAPERRRQALLLADSVQRFRTRLAAAERRLSRVDAASPTERAATDAQVMALRREAGHLFVSGKPLRPTPPRRSWWQRALSLDGR